MVFWIKIDVVNLSLCHIFQIQAIQTCQHCQLCVLGENSVGQEISEVSFICFMHHFTCWTLLISRINRAWLYKGHEDSGWQLNVDLAQLVRHWPEDPEVLVSNPTAAIFWRIFFGLPCVKICQVIWQKCLSWKTQMFLSSILSILSQIVLKPSVFIVNCVCLSVCLSVCSAINFKLRKSLGINVVPQREGQVCKITYFTYSERSRYSRIFLYHY